MALHKELEHGSTAVVCNNRSELMYVLEWAKSKDKRVAPYMEQVDEFPYCICPSGEIVGWTDQMDRALYYMPFNEFQEKI